MPFLTQNVYIYVNKQKVGELFVDQDKEYELKINKDYFNQKDIYISFVLPDAKNSPFIVGQGTEERKLGIAMEYINLTESKLSN